MGLIETVIDIPAEHEANVFGQFDAYAKKIERRHNAVHTKTICFYELCSSMSKL